ncbi:peptide/nickel transport system permease protein [Stella humosa]|uniref:Peptide/nickel transport system permease protein n=1 Tax=Stella humosa TaxID=94 RepID=A0A3N1M9B6_9PROT|nr:ABC transporter permease [Stella humosa]ROP99634.1 peptide/nickel transport system permease protein [Stella humosa]BBK31141.1 ABC transporter permease [Stella humosa]
MTAAQRFRTNIAACIGLLILAAMVLLAVLAPVLYPTSPWEMAGEPYLRPLQGGYLLGTDMLGRDIAAGIAHGARVSLLLALVATAAGTLAGVLVGAVAGYFGGRIDELLMRATEFFQTIPSFLLAVVLVALFSPSISSIVAAIAVVSWPGVARLVRGQFLSLRQAEFVQASIVLGEPTHRVIFRQILPNALGPIIVTASLMVATAILLESSLSFLGLGDPDLMSWGYMIGASRNLIRDAWWMCTFPGVAIFLTVLAINLVGDGLGDALNPRLTS